MPVELWVANMTARDLLNKNGTLIDSPLIVTAQTIHALLSDAAIPYVFIGGLSVIRNGALRTTLDVDVLVRANDLDRVLAALDKAFETGPDHAVDRSNGVDVDILFSGDEWEMIIPLPDPNRVAQFDAELKANFLGLRDILELKTAVYLNKKKEAGIEIAAKDLADIVSLLQNNRSMEEDFFTAMHPRLRKELKKIWRKISKSQSD